MKRLDCAHKYVCKFDFGLCPCHDFLKDDRTLPSEAVASEFNGSYEDDEIPF